MYAERSMGTDADAPGGRFSGLVRTHSLNGVYKPELALKSVLELLARDAKALTLYTMQRKQHPKTVGEIRKGVPPWLKSIGVPSRLFRTGENTVKHYFWSENLREDGLSIGPGQLVSAGFVERSAFIEYGFEVSKYKITPAGEDLIKPIIASAINFIHYAVNLNGKPLNASLYRILGERERPFLVYELLRYMMEMAGAAPRTTGTIVAYFKDRYSVETIRRTLSDLGKCGIIDYTSTGTIRSSAEDKADKHSFMRFELKDIKLLSYDESQMRRKVMSRRLHRVPPQCFVAAAQMFWDVKKEGDPSPSGNEIGTLTVSRVAEMLVEKYGIMRLTAEHYASEILRVFSDLKAIAPVEGINGTRKSIVQPNELTHVFYNTVLKPARYTMFGLVPDERLNPTLAKEAVETFISNYERHKSGKGDPGNHGARRILRK
jgi:hypothetical protein